MTKVITYGTFDLLHYGHTNLLKRAKDLGDYLIVGVTAEAYDMARGKINVKQSLSERIENVRETGLADEIIVEEYEGQKIAVMVQIFLPSAQTGKASWTTFLTTVKSCILTEQKAFQARSFAVKSASFLLALLVTLLGLINTEDKLAL